MVARSKYLRENLVKQDGTPATDDEFEKTIEEESQLQVQSSQTNLMPKLGGRSKASEDLTSRLIKGFKQKKEKNDVRISSEAPEQITEIAVVEERLSNRPPTPPKPKTLLPPLDLSPFIRLDTVLDYRNLY